MAAATCFSRDELRSYLLGELPDAESDGVASHLEACVACEATVVALDRESDTLIVSLREPAAPDEASPPDDAPSAYRLAAKRAAAQWREAMLEPESPVNGRRLRDYELLAPLAQGGMGTVYRARHVRLNRFVALKVLPDRVLRNPAIVARFEREMQAVGALQHPAIVQATDGGEAEGVHFLVMELIEGIDGAAMVQSLGPLSPEAACEVARQAAVGMAYVHGQGIIHRDLKPSNLMVTKTGEVKLLDLGLARVLGEQLAEDELTTVGQLMGTLDFMAPEQLENSHDVDERADVYALGATLYKLLTGQSPHAGDRREPLLSKLRRITSEPPAPLEQRRAELPADLCEFVGRLLSRERDRRPSSMREVADSLAKWSRSGDLSRLVHQALNARQRQAARSSGLPLIGTKDSASPSAAEVQSHHQHHRLGWLLATAALLLAVACGVIITLHTMAGQLVIETAEPGVEVRILKAGRPHRELTLKQQANTLRLAAGEYEVEIVSDADGLEVENGQYTLKRGETWLARIVHSAEPATLGPRAAPAVTPDHAAPTFEGQTLDEWLRLLTTERSPQQLYEACRALEKLATGDDQARAATAVLLAIRFHNSASSFRQEGNEQPVVVWYQARDLLRRFNQDVVVSAINAELARDADANVDFILDYLDYRNSSLVKDHVDQRLFQHIQRLTSDSRPHRRIEALGILRAVGPQDTVARKLTAALSDQEVEVQLFAAKNLIDIKLNPPLVVASLRRILSQGNVYERAQAAWYLGELGPRAKEALPELLAAVEEASDESDQTMYLSGMSDRVSLKDAVVRALAGIGDDSVVPVLVAEWERRAALPGTESRQLEAVASAIEMLIGVRPHDLREGFGAPRQMVWAVSGATLESVYAEVFARGGRRRAFISRGRDDLRDPVSVAVKLLPRAKAFELDGVLEMIARPYQLPTAEQLELEIQLLTLLTRHVDTTQFLRAIFRRGSWYGFSETSNHSPLSPTQEKAQADTIEAYRAAAVRILQSDDQWRENVVPEVIAVLDRSDRLDWPAGLLLTDVLTELSQPEQVAAVTSVLQFWSLHGDRLPPWWQPSLDAVAAWLEDHRAAINQQVKEMTGRPWQALVLGLLQAGLDDGTATEEVKQRFEKDVVNRAELLDGLTRTFESRPELASLMVELLQSPALDAPEAVQVTNGKRTEYLLRAKYLRQLSDIPSRHREQFIPYLRHVAESDNESEASAAKQILQRWQGSDFPVEHNDKQEE